MATDTFFSQKSIDFQFLTTLEIQFVITNPIDFDYSTVLHVRQEILVSVRVHKMTAQTHCSEINVQLS